MSLSRAQAYCSTTQLLHYTYIGNITILASIAIIWRIRILNIIIGSFKFGDDRYRLHMHNALQQLCNVWRFVIWQISANSLIHQKKTLAKFSHYRVCIAM